MSLIRKLSLLAAAAANTARDLGRSAERATMAIKELLKAREVEHAERFGPPHKRRRGGAPGRKKTIATAFQIAWEKLRRERMEAGLPVSGATRAFLRARLRGRPR